MVQSLSQPLKLSFIITSVPSGKTVGCVYFDEQERIWVKTGLTATGPAGNTLICTSSHATFFAPSYDNSPTDVEGEPICSADKCLLFLGGITHVKLLGCIVSQKSGEFARILRI